MKKFFPSKKFWEKFVNRFEIYKSIVPLFKRSEALIVETKLYGQDDRKTFGNELLNEEGINR